ncbi:MAG: YopX family protein [Thermoplasmata archaeon]
MKDLKFRVWDKKKKKMLSWGDSLVIFEHVITEKEYKSVKFRYMIDFIRSRFWNELQQKFEIMLFTGVRDKVGREIYEGDIILIYNDYDWISYIAFEKGAFIPKPERIGHGPLFLLNHYHADIEVIGNIFENPELLKVKK